MLGNCQGYDNIVAYLLDKDTELHAVIKNGSTALMVAVAGGRAEINSLFMDEGDKWDVKSKAGWTALKVAFKLGKKKVFLQLNESRGK